MADFGFDAFQQPATQNTATSNPMDFALKSQALQQGAQSLQRNNIGLQSDKIGLYEKQLDIMNQAMGRHVGDPNLKWGDIVDEIHNGMASHPDIFDAKMATDIISQGPKIPPGATPQQEAAAVNQWLIQHLSVTVPGQQHLKGLLGGSNDVKDAQGNVTNQSDAQAYQSRFTGSPQGTPGVSGTQIQQPGTGAPGAPQQQQPGHGIPQMNQFDAQKGATSTDAYTKAQAFANTWQSRINPMIKAYHILDQYHEGQDNTATGPWSGTVQEVGRRLVQMGLITNPAAIEGIAQKDQLFKYLAQVAAQNGTGGNTDMQRELGIETSPNQNQSVEGARALLKNTIGLTRMEHAKVLNFQKSGRNPSQYSDYAPQFSTQFDPAGFTNDLEESPGAPIRMMRKNGASQEQIERYKRSATMLHETPGLTGE